MRYRPAVRNPRKNPPAPLRPAAAVESLDRGLRLLQVLRDYGSLRVADAAQYLDISRSSAHRLLQTLVYRGFAVQDESRMYLPGPSMDAAPARLAWTKELRRVCRPHLEVLARRSRETAHVLIRVGPHVRVLATVRPDEPDAISERDGAIMRAHETASGKALLAELADPELRALYAAPAAGGAPVLGADAVTRLLGDVAATRGRGFAINVEGSERGLAAVGAAVHDRHGDAIAAIAVSTRAERFAASLDKVLVPLVLDARAQIEHDLADVELGGGA